MKEKGNVGVVFVGDTQYTLPPTPPGLPVRGGVKMREGEDVVCKENLNSPIVGSQLGRKLWYPEDSVKTSYLLASVQHLDTGAGGGDFWRLLSMLELLELLEVGTGIPDPFNARLIAFSSSTLDNQIISLAKDRSRITGF